MNLDYMGLNMILLHEMPEKINKVQDMEKTIGEQVL